MKNKNAIIIGDTAYIVNIPSPKIRRYVASEANRLVKNASRAIGVKTLETIVNDETMELFFNNLSNLTDSGVIMSRKELRTLIRASFLGSIYVAVQEAFSYIAVQDAFSYLDPDNSDIENENDQDSNITENPEIQ